MHLNPDQKQALDKGQPVPMTVDQRECVLIRKDVYEQVLETNPEETYAAVEKILDQEEDPGLQSYQQYKR